MRCFVLYLAEPFGCSVVSRDSDEHITSDEGVHVASDCTDTDMQTVRGGGAMANGVDLCKWMSSRTV